MQQPRWPPWFQLDSVASGVSNGCGLAAARDFCGGRRYDARMYRLRNQVMNYAWGSLDAIPTLQGRTPGQTPEAELWMGAHPKAPSLVEVDGTWRPLSELVASDPQAWVGPTAQQAFGDTLPFLFKVLAAGTPLSLQAHPSIPQAQAGYAAEDARRIPLDAPHRNYRDRNHKPELICALTRFEALCGFRSRDTAAALFHELAVAELAGLVGALWDNSKTDDEALRDAFAGLMRLPRSAQVQAAEAAVHALPTSNSPFLASYGWARRLAALYPGDIGVVCSLLLNQVTLQPGQALFLPAGNLHAYLEGVGVELMANSDNVLRGGCTPKHVDVEELLKVLSFRGGPVAVIRPSPADASVQRYRTSAAEFELSRVQIQGHVELSAAEGPRILLVTAGEVCASQADTMLTLATGQSVYIKPGGDSITLKSNEATCFSAGLGRS